MAMNTVRAEVLDVGMSTWDGGFMKAGALIKGHGFRHTGGDGIDNLTRKHENVDLWMTQP
jgi:hypothetical protein